VIEFAKPKTIDIEHQEIKDEKNKQENGNT